MTPAASFIVRAKDKAATIERTLRSIRDQTVAAEIVVVDSGSVDGTLELAERWADRVVRIPPERFTYGYALNLGAEHAAAPVHVALSAHCVLPHADWLARCLSHYGRADVAAVGGRRRQPHEPDTLATFLQTYAHARNNPWWGFSNHAASWRADVWRRIRFDEQLGYAEDKEWALRILAEGWLIAFDAALLVDMSHQLRTTLGDFTSRQRRAAEAIASFSPTSRYGPRELAADWWSGEVDHRPAWRRRLSPHRIAGLLAKFYGFRLGVRRRSPAAPDRHGAAPEVAADLRLRSPGTHGRSVPPSREAEPHYAPRPRRPEP
jgi:rhamnosyltransferase